MAATLVQHSLHRSLGASSAQLHQIVKVMASMKLRIVFGITLRCLVARLGGQYE